jgi:type II secretory pathway pseudopilin PulG
MRTPKRNRGFSLTETLCVIGCIAAALAMLGGTTWHVQSSMQLRNSAAEFLQTVKTARQYAVDHRCRTRIAFRAGLFREDETTAANDALRTYRIHAFIVPSSTPGDAGRWVRLGGADTKEAHAEWARVELTPRSESLVGRWLVCDLDPKARRVADVVKVTSPLFERFRGDEPDKFFAENFYTPETTWAFDKCDPHEPKNCFSVFPENYRSTPAGAGPVLLTGALPAKEECLDPMTGVAVSASTFWPGDVRFIRGASADGSEELPGIEFQPDGSLACVWTRELAFSFAYANRPQTNYVVLIDTATGLARIEQPAVK